MPRVEVRPTHRAQAIAPGAARWREAGLETRPQCFLGARICGMAGCDASKPAGFYQVKDWSSMQYLNGLESGKVKCP